MSIETKDWTAQIDRMPGAASFRAFGTVTVAHTGITPCWKGRHCKTNPLICAWN
jgi:hypothetical protein